MKLPKNITIQGEKVVNIKKSEDILDKDFKLETDHGYTLESGDDKEKGCHFEVPTYLNKEA